VKIRTGFVSNSSSSSFAVLGFEVTPEIRNKVKKLVGGVKEQTEERWCCSKCNHEPVKQPKFCDKCGGEMHTATRVKEIEWDDYELFEAIGMSHYPETEYGDVAGFDVDGKTAEQITELNQKLVEKLGEETYTVMIGEYAS